ncbi:hypothetical protein DPMN_125314 [Dreissena polymorpha]|uniref:Zinc finger PHD-type domain-containing protein n=1 Tax=Dreissena polymorpha TaxID=45954 RepID=A0A9D4GV27_DREPO|nr:hypothetical protein DPMN_125314 [Dreissena polymorpha]
MASNGMLGMAVQSTGCAQQGFAMGKGPEVPGSTGSQTVPAQKVTEYQLRMDKSLAKKLSATRRTKHLEIEIKSGNFVIAADLATFELLKEAALYFYRNDTSVKCDTVIQSTVDQKNSSVSYAIKHKFYTINIYATTSKFMVNGQNTQLFVGQHLSAIQNIVRHATVNGQPVNLNSVNQLLADSIQNALFNSSIATEQSSKAKTSVSSKPSNSIKAKNSGNKPTERVEPEVKCLKCNRTLKTGVECTVNHKNEPHWIHYGCLNLSDTELEFVKNQPEDAPYTYTLCAKYDNTQTLPMKIMANSSTLNISALPNIPVSNAFAILTEKQAETDPVLNTEQ